jgi:ATP-dependent exoDNAse (exonuclease V) beta subunit
VVDKQEYYLTGIIDLLLGEDGKWELLDFKANRRIDDPDHRTCDLPATPWYGK